MKKGILVATALCLFVLFTSSGLAYEPGTHQQLSSEAAKKSQLNGVLKDLGMKAMSDPTQTFRDSQAGDITYLSPNKSNKYRALDNLTSL